MMKIKWFQAGRQPNKTKTHLLDLVCELMRKLNLSKKEEQRWLKIIDGLYKGGD